MKKLIIIPAFNEEKNLLHVVKDISGHCPEFDFIIINDGSTDNTLNICNEEKLPAIHLTSNLGFSGAVQTGYKYAIRNDYDIIVQFDGDGQHQAHFIPQMVDLIEKHGIHYVIGSRFKENKKHFSIRMVGSRVLSALIRLRTGKKIFDPTSGMRAVTGIIAHKMAQNLNFIAEPDTLVRVILTGFLVEEVQVVMKERKQGVSHFRNPINSIVYMMHMVISILFLQSGRWS